MKKLVLAGLTCAGLIALLPDTAMAHGGQYRGPGDVVPPSPGGGRGTGGPAGPTTGGPAGPSTPGPAGPSTPGPAGPSTGGPAGPGPGRGPTTGGRGITLDDDLTTWDYWWEFNKDPFIRLKEAVHTGGVTSGSDDFFLGSARRTDAKDTLRPTDADKIDIVDSLKKVIDSTEQRDIASSCMIAMAKVGKTTTFDMMTHVFAPRLKRADQEIREVAALAIGIANLAEKEHVKLLSDLLLDTPEGRAACDRSDVDQRTRSFAGYALGLIAHSTSTIEVKRAIFNSVSKLLVDEKLSSRDLKVAAVNAISLLNISGSSEGEKNLMNDALKALGDYYRKDLGVGEQLMQSHVPPAIAKLIGRDHERSAEFKALFAADLSGKGKEKRSNEIAMSCALALGRMAKPCENETKGDDDAISDLLVETYDNHKDAQTKNFALLALGQIGGTKNRDTLIKLFDKGSKNMEKPWAALAMGVYAFQANEAAKARKSVAPLERAFGDAIRGALSEVREPLAAGGLAVALGLMQYKDASFELRELLNKNKSKEDMAGYICIGLALMGDTASIEDIRTIVSESTRKDRLLQQASVALGKLGDKNVADQLLTLLGDGGDNLAKLSAIASALGFIGDRRSIEPLKKLLFNEEMNYNARAFAAVALGGVADKESLPWNSKLSQNLNYRASVETLTNRSTGILDIL